MIAMACRCVVTANRQSPYRPAGIVGFGLAAIRYGCNVVERLKAELKKVGQSDLDQEVDALLRELEAKR